jgi:hypothetical protein
MLFVDLINDASATEHEVTLDIGILTFVPYLACLLNIFSPWLLEHFRKRKGILVASKLLANTINILGITLLPVLVKNPTALLICFIILTITSSCINQLFASGFSAVSVNYVTKHYSSCWNILQ